ncbi:NUC173 domain-containing protein [Cladochytrium replicatum]|nr:NUC173 domain-containing protein [Cladochytrium replicatum]
MSAGKPPARDGSTEFSRNPLFVKIRSQVSSGLGNQRQVAAWTLAAVEAAIREKNESLSPAAYFLVLMIFVREQAEAAARDAERLQVLLATFYLLSIVCKRVEAKFMRFQSETTREAIGRALELHIDQAPLVRAAIECYQALLIAQDNNSWSSNHVVKKTYNQLLRLTLDARPKVRKAAHDSIAYILQCPPPPTRFHPATVTTIDFITSNLSQSDRVRFPSNVDFATVSDQKQSSAASKNDQGHQMAFYLLAFLSCIAISLAKQAAHPKSKSKMTALIECLIKLPVKSTSAGKVYLTQAVFESLLVLVTGKKRSISVEGEDDELKGDEERGDLSGESALPSYLDHASIDYLIRALLEIQPFYNDPKLIPTWLELVGTCYVKLASAVAAASADRSITSPVTQQYVAETYPALLALVFEKIFSPLFGKGNHPAVMSRAAATFSTIIEFCVSEHMLNDAESHVAMAQEDASLDEAPPPLIFIIRTINKGFGLRCKDAWGHILRITESLFTTLGQHEPELIRGTLNQVLEFRDAEDYGSEFPFKHEVESALQAALQSLGLETFFLIAPLNIENEFPGLPRRPYLLTLASKALERPVSGFYSQHSLRYFADATLDVLARRMYTRSVEAMTSGKQVEAKLFETLLVQVWDLLPKMCATVPRDVADSFDSLCKVIKPLLMAPVEEALGGVPSGYINVRNQICSALGKLVEMYFKIANMGSSKSDDSDDEDSESDDGEANEAEIQIAQKGLTKLKEHVNWFLNVLCNHYTTIPSHLLLKLGDKGLTLQILEQENVRYGQAIHQFLKIAEEKAISSYFLNLVRTLLQNQSSSKGGSQRTAADTVNDMRMYAIMDLLLILLPKLPTSTSAGKNNPHQLYFKVLSGQLANPDPTMQKKTYKSLSVLIPSLQHSELSQLGALLADSEVISGTSPGAKRPRLRTFSVFVEAVIAIPQPREIIMNFAPQVLAEVILGTKETNERARFSAFDCLLGLARAMYSLGGVGQVDDDVEMGDEEASTETRQPSLAEFILMVSAGLVQGASPHMQSATITCLGRLLFEFRAELGEGLTRELLTTVMETMSVPSSANNREIIKAFLGFVKVVVVCLSAETLSEFLPAICESILRYSRDHKSHFKAKVRHLFERLIRKCGYDTVFAHIPESDQKLLNNIRKRRERLKRKKLENSRESGAGRNADSDDEGVAGGAGGIEEVKERMRRERQREYDEAVHGSESELGSDDDAGDRMDEDDDHSWLPEPFESQSRVKSKGSQRIREDQQEVLDFLSDNVVSNVTYVGPSRQESAKGGLQKGLPTSADGRVIIEDDEPSEMQTEEQATAQEDFYRQTITGEGAFTRTPDGRIKFIHKDAGKKRARDDDEEGKSGGGLGSGRWGAVKGGPKKKAKGQLDDGAVKKMLGGQYKAKKAKGDVKKAGMPDPFAYIPLSTNLMGKKKRATRAIGQFKAIVAAARSNSEVGEDNKGARAASQRKGINKQNKRHK